MYWKTIKYFGCILEIRCIIDGYLRNNIITANILLYNIIIVNSQNKYILDCICTYIKSAREYGAFYIF